MDNSMDNAPNNNNNMNMISSHKKSKKSKKKFKREKDNNPIQPMDIIMPIITEIVASMHPLPVTTRQDLVSGQLSGFFAALYLVIAFSFIPACAIYFMVNEKTNLTKHQQLVSGISFIAYWVSNYIADICIGLPASILVFLSVYVFDAIPFTYLLSFLFSAPSKAQLGTIFGMILGLVSFILDSIPSTQETNSDLKGLYRIFPVYIMCESLLNISLKPLLFPFDEYNDPLVCHTPHIRDPKQIKKKTVVIIIILAGLIRLNGALSIDINIKH